MGWGRPPAIVRLGRLLTFAGTVFLSTVARAGLPVHAVSSASRRFDADFRFGPQTDSTPGDGATVLPARQASASRTAAAIGGMDRRSIDTDVGPSDGPRPASSMNLYFRRPGQAYVPPDFRASGPWRPTPLEPPPPAPAGDWFDAWKRVKQDLADRYGTHLSLYIANTPQAVLNGRREGHLRNTFWWNLNLTQDLWPGGRLITNTRGGIGDGVGPLTADGLNTNWMSGEPDPLYVSHVLLEQKLLGDHLTFWLGKLDIDDHFDTNAAASWNFLSYSLARNGGIPVPWHTIGAVARFDPADWLYVQAGVVDAQGEFTETGFNTAFHDEDYTFSMAEVGFTAAPAGRTGHYRFLVWYDPQPVARLDGRGAERDDLGLAVSFDQQVTDSLTLFLRYGWSDPDLRRAEHFWSAGGVVAGPLPGRPKDELGLGVGQALIGDDFRRAAGSASSESIVELYYKIALTEYLHLTPDVQVLLHPGGDRDRDVGVVAGLRLSVTF